MASANATSITIDEIQTFIPSYEQPEEGGSIEGPSPMQKAVEGFVTAAVWAGVLARWSTTINLK